MEKEHVLYIPHGCLVQEDWKGTVYTASTVMLQSSNLIHQPEQFLKGSAVDDSVVSLQLAHSVKASNEPYTGSDDTTAGQDTLCKHAK